MKELLQLSNSDRGHSSGSWLRPASVAGERSLDVVVPSMPDGRAFKFGVSDPEEEIHRFLSQASWRGRGLSIPVVDQRWRNDWAKGAC